MPIPAFNSLGLLPEGIHQCSLLELKGVLSLGVYRREQLLGGLDRCIKLMHTEALHGKLYVDGSFVTDKEHPDDLELTLDVRDEPRIAQDRALWFFHRFFSEVRGMGVDWYVTLPDERDVTTFFQQVGEKTAAAKKIGSHEKKGILRLTSW